MTHRVTFRCEQGHEDSVTWHDVDPEFIALWAGLVDGTSPEYQNPPDDRSVIGKCGICGSKLSSTISEVPKEAT